MELRIWLLLFVVLVIALAVLLIAAVLVHAWKRMHRLEARVADWDLWSDCVDNALDPATAHIIKTAYAERKRRAANR